MTDHGEEAAVEPVVGSPVMGGDDGELRCFGADDPLYRAYHDEEWGRPVRDERGLYERMSLEAFQSGLAWITILRKREALPRGVRRLRPGGGRALRRRRRRAADGRRGDRAQPRQDRGDDRQRPGGARPARRRRRSLAELVWSPPPGRPAARPRRWAEVPAATPESTALAKALKRRGFRFVGPTTAYAAMQAAGWSTTTSRGASRGPRPRPRSASRGRDELWPLLDRASGSIRWGCT